jgi:hypothetical protein
MPRPKPGAEEMKAARKIQAATHPKHKQAPSLPRLDLDLDLSI